MDLSAAGLTEQPFPTHGKPPVTVSYIAHKAALDVIRATWEHQTGLSLIQGPPLSGKTTLIRSFLEDIDRDSAVATIDGGGLGSKDLLRLMMSQFGYETDLSTTSELMGLVRVFALQQTASTCAPLLIIENTHELKAEALRTLCELAELQVNETSALKMVLVSNKSMRSIVSAEAMTPVTERLLHDFHLRPMSRDETRRYIHAKLKVAGSDDPQTVFTDEVCLDVWQASGGWPGIVDRVALLALAEADTRPVSMTNIEHPELPKGTWADDGASTPEFTAPHSESSDPPRLVVMNNGRIVDDMMMHKPRIIVGRTEHNDISIDSRFVSRHHLLLVRHGSTTFLMDLNSTNGTFVNSRRVGNHILLHEDVITLGHHTIKFYDPCATTRVPLDSIEFTDTAVMKTLDDMRNLLARENTALLALATEKLPSKKK